MSSQHDGSHVDHAGFDSALETMLKMVAASTKAEIAYRSGQFEICGTLSEVRRSLPLILTSSAVNVGPAIVPYSYRIAKRPVSLFPLQNSIHEIRFQCELAVDHRDFMAGKRNGKISKITRATGSQIKFDQFSKRCYQ
jgi:hypothetical protein